MADRKYLGQYKCERCFWVLVRVEPGGGTGDTVYVTEDGARIYERLGEHRVEVIEGDMKFGPRRIRVLR